MARIPRGPPGTLKSTPAEGLTGLPSEPRLTHGSWRITGLFDGCEGRQLLPGGGAPLPDAAGGQPDHPETGRFAGAAPFCAWGAAGATDGCRDASARVCRTAAEPARRGEKGPAGTGRTEARRAFAGRQ